MQKESATSCRALRGRRTGAIGWSADFSFSPRAVLQGQALEKGEGFFYQQNRHVVVGLKTIPAVALAAIGVVSASFCSAKSLQSPLKIIHGTQ